MSVISSTISNKDHLAGIETTQTDESFIVEARRQMIICEAIYLEGTGVLTIEGTLCLIA